MERRVVITGVGVISPVGNDISTFWNNIKNGVCGIDKITRFDTTDFKVKLAGEVKDFDPKALYKSPAEVRRVDMFTHYAIKAADEAVNDCGILESGMDKRRLGVYIGSGIGGMQSFVAETLILNEKGPSKVSPMFVPKMISNIASGMVAIRFGAKGPSMGIVTACATSAHTIGEAYRAVKHGYADAIIAGGTESSVEPLAVAGFTSCQALHIGDDPSCASIPFDARRSGFVMGEGAGIVVVEEYEQAVKRGAHIYAEIVGYGATTDAYHMTAPDPTAEEPGNAIRIAINDAGITGDEEIYINAHGTSTKLNDKTETEAFKKVFGEKAYKLHISSTKSMTGHMLGATGAVEAIVSVLALKDGIVPPTVGYSEKDPECDLDYTPNNAVKANLKYALSTNLGFGGHNACLAFKKI